MNNPTDKTPGPNPRRAASGRTDSGQSRRNTAERAASRQNIRTASDRTAEQRKARSSGEKRNASPYKKSASTGQRNSRKRKIYRRSAYYRKQQLKIRIITGAAALLLLVLLLFVIRGCSGCGKDKSTAASSGNADSVSMEDTKSGKSSSQKDGEGSDGDGIADSEDTSALPAEPVSLTVSVVGDCTLGTDEYFDYDSSLNAYFYSYGKEYFMQNVKSIFSADDLTIANFEGTLTDLDTREDKQFAFKAPAEFAGILSCSSVETVNTANNHSHDYGEQSFTDTMAALDAEGIVHFGYDETAVVDVKGIKVGLVGIYELNDHLERTEQLKTNIAKVKADGAQLIIVIFHWGNEKETVPDTNQMTLGRLAIDEGADLVCGHHPHVLQGIEEYKGKNIVYSLGNFCFGGNTYPSDMDTMIFQQTFTIDKDGVKADNVTNIIPCSVSSDYSYNNYQPTPAEGEEATRIMNKIQERSSWIPAAETTQETGSDTESEQENNPKQDNDPESETA
ncbi:MAG: CapA family protein [Eubacteriales bacterium]|nr:CapA family protein [Eubacteriales bacterium]